MRARSTHVWPGIIEGEARKAPLASPFSNSRTFTPWQRLLYRVYAFFANISLSYNYFPFFFELRSINVFDFFSLRFRLFCRFVTFSSVPSVSGIYVIREVLVQKYDLRLTVRISRIEGDAREAPLACSFSRNLQCLLPFRVFFAIFIRFSQISRSVSIVLLCFSDLSYIYTYLVYFFIVFFSISFFRQFITCFLGFVFSWYFSHSWTICTGTRYKLRLTNRINTWELGQPRWWFFCWSAMHRLIFYILEYDFFTSCWSCTNQQTDSSPWYFL